jgi:hypothetical protein
MTLIIVECDARGVPNLICCADCGASWERSYLDPHGEGLVSWAVAHRDEHRDERLPTCPPRLPALANSFTERDDEQ